jgi:hypothetical protein
MVAVKSGTPFYLAVLSDTDIAIQPVKEKMPIR